MSKPLLKIEGLGHVYGARRGLFGTSPAFRALTGIDISVARGESFGLVGESGSGKTTLTRNILGLERPSEGHVLFDGHPVIDLGRGGERRLRRRMQIVFQDPQASLDPRMTIHDTIAEALVIHGPDLGIARSGYTRRVLDLLEAVGLGREHLYRHPHEFSGGQRQRINIARALAVEPELLILDEPTSALDVSVQADILNLLQRLQKELGLTYFFISHDLGVIRYTCDRVAVIERGRIVEQGPVAKIFDTPSQDYTRKLMDAIPDPDPDLSPLRRLA
ncbi:ATP-binding cassette domain-containing protein [Pseudooceanicola sp. HF7]|uniref:ATP-binding cassette domain-containing protein n=1 Tax=Pseudooceanicola sp. HF7 TaxID=2721560 RepID=UPI00142FA47A|nr:ATP-binding cassette domain-containing protein [Pseudooceanicola sp. HF7]NIZ11258.1 ABC transporter ATP-binding protein [Pseudooceanicola sp. HF7]